MAICLTALLRFPFGLLCYSLAFCFPLLELTPWFFCICWEFRFCCCCGFFILFTAPALEIPAFAQHPSAEEENPSAEQKTHLQKTTPTCRRPIFCFWAFVFQRSLGMWARNLELQLWFFFCITELIGANLGTWGAGGRQTRRQTDRLGVLTLSQYLFFFSCFVHGTTILFSLESHHHIPFVNCLVVVVVVLLAFPTLSVLKQASSSVVSTLFIFSWTQQENQIHQALHSSWVLEVGELDLKTGFLLLISLGLAFFLYSLLPASFLEFSIPSEAEVTRQQFPFPQFLLLDLWFGLRAPEPDIVLWTAPRNWVPNPWLGFRGSCFTAAVPALLLWLSVISWKTILSVCHLLGFCAAAAAAAENSSVSGTHTHQGFQILFLSFVSLEIQNPLKRRFEEKSFVKKGVKSRLGNFHLRPAPTEWLILVAALHKFLLLHWLSSPSLSWLLCLEFLQTGVQTQSHSGLLVPSSLCWFFLSSVVVILVPFPHCFSYRSCFNSHQHNNNKQQQRSRFSVFVKGEKRTTCKQQHSCPVKASNPNSVVPQRLSPQNIWSTEW